jgi:transposase-like protein
MSGKRISAAQKEAVIRDIRARKQSYQSISKKHSISVSTVSRLANEIGLGRPQKKTKPGDTPEHSYDRSQRISALDRMLNSIDKMVEQGGLSTSQLKDLASAASSVYATRRSEDIESDPETKKEDEVVWLEELGTPGESKGIGVRPGTYIGDEMLKLKAQFDAEDALAARENEDDPTATVDEDGHDDS